MSFDEEPISEYMNMVQQILRRIQDADGANDTDFAPEHFEMVLRVTNRTETRIKRIIARYIDPSVQRVAFVEQILLSNPIVSLGSKIKVLLALAKDLEVPIDRDAFHTMLNSRNALAHQDFANAWDFKIEPDGTMQIEIMVESINGNGTIERQSRQKVFEKFLSTVSPVDKGLDLLEQELKIGAYQNPPIQTG